jgi:hypothetical protein
VSPYRVIAVEGPEIEVLQQPAAAARAREHDLRVERPALAGQHLEELVREAVRHARHVGARARHAPADLGDVAPCGDVEEARLDGHLVAVDADAALHELLRADRRPADEVDLFGVDARRLVLDERARIDQLEVARELEVTRQHARELLAERAAVVTAEVLQRCDRDGKRLATGSEYLAGDDGARRSGQNSDDDGQHESCDESAGHPEARPPSSSEWNSMMKSRNSFA